MCLVLLVGASLAVVFNLTYRGSIAALTREAEVKAQLQVAALQSELDKQRSAPVILADDSDVMKALSEPSEARALAISKKLAKLQAELKSAAIYLIDHTGRTISSSNYQAPTSFVGSNYAFRRYFTDAIKEGQAEQFALGTVSQHPGLYVSHRAGPAPKPLGVVVVKVQFDAIEAQWAHAHTTTIVTNSARDILLTSIPALRFRKGFQPMSSQISASLAAPGPGWRLYLLGPSDPAFKAARNATLMAAMAWALMLTVIGWLWRRRRRTWERAAAEHEYRERLERDVAERTVELSRSNAQLSQEIAERQDAERRLNALQADLVQANKLASLGQITAGVAHEINQPLTAIRVLSENALTVLKRDGTKRPAPVIGQNLADIVRLSERIGHITGELRTFSRKATGETGPVPLKEAIESSIQLNRSRLRHDRVRLKLDKTVSAKLSVIGGRVRLEQVLVNLLQNAFEALEQTPNPEVHIATEVDGEWVRVRISDNGPGIDEAVMRQLFIPFVTTKEKGLGLGLVIAHDILRDFGGELSAENADSGAVFTLKMRVAP